VTPQFRQKKEKNSPIFPKNAEPNKKRKVKFSGRKIKLEKTSLIYSPKKKKEIQIKTQKIVTFMHNIF
jgi:hypothetical protein